MADNPYLQWPVFRRSVVAAFQRSLTHRAQTTAPTAILCASAYQRMGSTLAPFSFRRVAPEAILLEYLQELGGTVEWQT
jgi:hypothetical protein